MFPALSPRFGQLTLARTGGATSNTFVLRATEADLNRPELATLAAVYPTAEQAEIPFSIRQKYPNRSDAPYLVIPKVNDESEVIDPISGNILPRHLIAFTTLLEQVSQRDEVFKTVVASVGQYMAGLAQRALRYKTGADQAVAEALQAQRFIDDRVEITGTLSERLAKLNG
jgi:hypothetical protein